MIVLYDGTCGFCRWAMAWALQHHRRQQLGTAPIQSKLGQQLLADVVPSERLRTVHVIDSDDVRHSGGDAVVRVLEALRFTRTLARLASVSPRLTESVYLLVADHRALLGRLIGASARERADALLEADLRAAGK